MSHVSKEIRKDVIRILEAHEINDYDFDRDGAGHQVVKFKYHRRSLHFHFPSTTKMNGHTRLNVLGSLKRQLREAAPPPTKVGIATVTPSSLIRPASQGEEKPAGPVDRHTAIYQAVTGGERLQTVADKFGISKTGVFRIAMAVKARLEGTPAKVTAPLASLLKPRCHPKKPSPKLYDRNRAIYAAVERGEKYAAVGRRFGNLTGARISQIAAEMGNYLKSLPPQAEQKSLTSATTRSIT